MKKIGLLTCAFLLMTSAAFASPDKDKGKKKDTIECAIMTGKQVNIEEATSKKMYADYKGNRYFFCCGGCPEVFKKHPFRYAKNPHIRTPKEKKGKKP